MSNIEKLAKVVDDSPEKTDLTESGEHRKDDFRLKQLDIGYIENAIYREKWWQLWYTFPLFSPGQDLLILVQETSRSSSSSPS